MSSAVQSIVIQMAAARDPMPTRGTRIGRAPSERLDKDRAGRRPCRFSRIDTLSAESAVVGPEPRGSEGFMMQVRWARDSSRFLSPVQIVGPCLHHLPSFGQERCAIVASYSRGYHGAPPTAFWYGGLRYRCYRRPAASLTIGTFPVGWKTHNKIVSSKAKIVKTGPYALRVLCQNIFQND